MNTPIPSPDRRVQRATDAATALRHKLARARVEASLEAVVLASYEGLTLAQDGDPSLCEQLAALAPLLSMGPWDDSLEVEFESTRISVRPFQVDGDPLFLAWSGDDLPSPAWLDAANRGVRRILATC